MPYMNGTFYMNNSPSVQKRIDKVEAIERAARGVVPAWNGKDANEVDEDIRTLMFRGRGSRHQYRGSDYTPRTSPRNLKRRHFMADINFNTNARSWSAMNGGEILFEIQHPKPKRSKVTVGVDFGSTDPHMVIITDEGVEPIGYRD